MKCPACDGNLVERSVNDIVVDVCDGGCGGIWFDRFELQKVDEARESVGEKLLDVKIDPATVVDTERRRSCPRCDNLIMMRHFFTMQRQIEVDTCPGCAGVWLDAHELGAVRDQFETEEARQRATAEQIDRNFGTQLAAMRQKSEASVERARSIARVFRFICPTYYIPGKQEWGAF